MTLIVSLLEHAFRVVGVFLFPAIALWAWRATGPSRLWAVTGVGLGLILLLAAFAASPIGGNALAARHGYGYTAPRSLLLHGLTLGLPVVAAAVVVQALARRVSSRLALYAIGVLCAGAAWVAGVLAAVLILATIS